MPTRNVSHGIGHRENGQAEGERNSDEADPEKWTLKVGAELRSQNSTSATAEHKPKRSDRFRDEFLTHIH
jgi:hypothetical protein